MAKTRMIVGLAPLALALLLAPGAASGHGGDRGRGHSGEHVRPTSQPQAFWYGEDVPPFEATLIHSALTNPNGGPIRALMNKLETENLNPTAARGLQPGHDTSKAYPGYTLLSSLISGAILLDMDGNVVRRWSPLSAFPARMLPGGSVMGFRGTGRPQYGDYARLVQLSWCGAEEWSWGGTSPGQNPAWGARGHHDWQREGNPVGYPAPGAKAIVDGNAAKNWILVHREPPLEATLGVSDIPLQDDAIIEIDANGQITWEWNAWEHFDEMGFDDVAKEAIRTNHVSSFGGTQGQGIPESDWQHLNATSLLGPNRWYEGGDDRFHPDNILWDGRTSNIIAIIARHDDPKGRWASGDIVWRTGPNYGVGNPENEVGQIIGQHTAHMIPHGLPGAGNILVFDNGGLAGFGSLLPGLPPYWPVAFRSYSRAVEYDPITFEKVWEYTNEVDDRANGGDRRFFSWFISSVQRLKNGNTLISEGHDGRVFEVTPDGEIVWEFYQWPGYVYRAYRYPASYLPEDQTCP
jgi:hypothetical protein